MLDLKLATLEHIAVHHKNHSIHFAHHWPYSHLKNRVIDRRKETAKTRTEPLTHPLTHSPTHSTHHASRIVAQRTYFHSEWTDRPIDDRLTDQSMNRSIGLPLPTHRIVISLQKSNHKP
jgi:hypothetical protein